MKRTKKGILSAILAGLVLLALGCGRKEAGPVFENGLAQPVFPYTEVTEDYDNSTSDIVRYCVWVETDNDMDCDGEKDLVKALVQVPRAAYEDEYKAASIFEARPYVSGTLDLKVWDKEFEAVTADVDPESWHYVSPFNEEEVLYEDMKWYDYFLVRGFAVVSSSGPGTLGSDGYVSIGGKEETEGFAAVIEWLHGDRKAYTDRSRTEEAEAKWSNGNVGMTGKSYGGTTQYALAARGVEGLKTVVPVAGITSWYDYIQGSGVSLDAGNSYFSYLSQYCSSSTYNTENFKKEKDKYLSYIMGIDSEMEALEGNYGGLWEEREYLSKLTDNSISMLIVEGMNDNNVRTNQLTGICEQLKEHGYEYKMILHQGGHQVPANPVSGVEIMIGEQSYDEILNKWFSHYLYDVDNKVEDMPQVQYQSNVNGTWSSYDAENTSFEEEVFELEKASLSSKTLPKKYDDWSEDVWYRQDNSAVKRYELATAGDEGIELCENATLSIKLTLNNIPDNAENLMVSAYLVDEYEPGFKAYMVDDGGQLATNVLKEDGMEQVPNHSAYDFVEYAQVDCDHKVITNAWFDLCNPGDDKDLDVWRKRSEPVLKGQTYEYTVRMDPVIHKLEKGHKLVLYIFPYDLSRIFQNSEEEFIKDSFYQQLKREYGFTVEDSSKLLVTVLP